MISSNVIEHVEDRRRAIEETVRVLRPVLPYALAFAAGAMIFVVVEEVIPESHSGGHPDLATSAAMVGFATMMVLDVALG